MPVMTASLFIMVPLQAVSQRNLKMPPEVTWRSPLHVQGRPENDLIPARGCAHVCVGLRECQGAGMASSAEGTAAPHPESHPVPVRGVQWRGTEAVPQGWGG